MKVGRMRTASWTPKDTHIYSECVILVAFLLQLWSHEGASALCYTYIACLVYHIVCCAAVNLCRRSAEVK
jgi:hypothetical protein